MNRNELSNSLIDFSKNLLVTIFAIFAFISKTLLETHNFSVKVTVFLSLLSAILSLNYAFSCALVKINFFLNDERVGGQPEGTSINNAKDRSIIILPSVQMHRIKKYVVYQYWSSLAALILLATAVLINFLYGG